MVSSSNARSRFRRSGQAWGIAVCLLLPAPGFSFAQSERDVCPKGYAIFETVCLSAATGDVVNQSRGNGAGSAPTKACAAHDLLVFGLIERHGEDQTLPAQLVADASMKLLRARAACRDGRDVEAIAIYTDLNASLTAAAGRR